MNDWAGRCSNSAVFLFVLKLAIKLYNQETRKEENVTNDMGTLAQKDSKLLQITNRQKVITFSYLFILF